MGRSAFQSPGPFFNPSPDLHTGIVSSIDDINGSAQRVKGMWFRQQFTDGKDSPIVSLRTRAAAAAHWRLKDKQHCAYAADPVTWKTDDMKSS